LAVLIDIVAGRVVVWFVAASCVDESSGYVADFDVASL